MIDWTRKMHIYAMEYYAAIRNDEFVLLIGTWMNLENIILSKWTQEQKMKHRIFSLIGDDEKREQMDTEKGVLNTGVYWGEKGRVSGRGRWGGIPWGEMPNVVYLHMEYYTDIKKKEIMPFAATQMELETIILSKLTQE